MFCMLLRKHLSGGKILSVTQEGFERIINISIESYDEMGYLSHKKLIVEIMGKHSNIILTDSNGKILDSIIHVDMSVSSVRQVLPGLIYELPPAQGKKNPMEQSIEDISFTLCHEEKEVWKQLLEAYTGISPLVAREAVHRALERCDLMGVEITRNELDMVAKSFFSLINDIKEKSFNPCIITDNITKKLLDFCAVDISQYENAAKTEHFATMNEAVENFYMKKASSESIRQRSGDLLKFLQTSLDRCYKKLQIQDQTLKKAAKRDKYKMYGDLITANIYRISQGMEEISLENFYSENADEVTIPLKSDLSPAKNAQRYYLKYNKEKTAEKETLKQKKLNEEEIDYLLSVQEAVQRCETNEEITQIRDELIEQGYLKNKGRYPKRKKDCITPMHFVSDDGLDIFVGKNNKQNDYVTLKLGRSTDLWFHTKGIHGSHVIVKTTDALKVPDKTYMQAAMLAAFYSKGRGSENVPVDYTEIVNVKKPSGAKPGMVIYVNYNTLFVTPSEDEINRLKDNR